MPLSVYRRHTSRCPAQRPQHDRQWLKCTCPLYVEGALAKVYVRESLRTRDYRAAVRIVQEAESRGYWKEPNGAGKGGPKLLADAIAAFLADCRNANGRNLRDSTFRSYRSLLGKFRNFVRAQHSAASTRTRSGASAIPGKWVRGRRRIRWSRSDRFFAFVSNRNGSRKARPLRFEVPGSRAITKSYRLPKSR